MLKISIILTLIFVVSSQAEVVRQLYFDTLTGVTEKRRDGVVVVETINGTKSTICNEGFSNNEAKVVCRMLGYSNGMNAFALISSKSSFNDEEVYFSNFSCTGNEASLDECNNFQFQRASNSCQGHTTDVHVFCNSRMNYSTYSIKNEKSGCNPTLMEMTNKLSEKSSRGLLMLKDGDKNYTFCGVNNNFGQNEARLFCKILCFKEVRFARIISNYEVRGASVGGFRRMRCPVNATSLSNCSRVYPDDRELCTPADNIGVACDPEPLPENPQATLSCSTSNLTLSWDKTIFPNVEVDSVNIVPYKTQNICHQTYKYLSDNQVILSVKLDHCEPNIKPLTEYLRFSYNVRRTFRKRNNLVVRNTRNFRASCLMQRRESINNGPIHLGTERLIAAGSSVKLNTQIELATDYDFKHPLQMPFKLNIGRKIFGLIRLVDAPNQIRLVLEKCYIYNVNNDRRTLISDKCAARADVKINPISDTVIKFSYVTFALSAENEALSIKCETSKCGKTEIGCFTSCQKS